MDIIITSNQSIIEQDVITEVSTTRFKDACVNSLRIFPQPTW